MKQPATDISRLIPSIGRSPDTERARVLVVDDDSRSREILAAYLGANHTVVEAVDGRSALRLLDQRVDLVLLDVMMPGMTGYDVCREIKRQTAREFVPVLMLTAANAQEDRNSGLAAGADDFLTKPVNRQELLLRMQIFLRLQRQERTICRQLEALRHLQRLKDDLVSLVVHDARSPLQTILVYLEGLELPAQLGEQDCTALESCARAARRVDRLLTDALDVRLLEEARMPLARARNAVRPLVTAAIETLDGAARKNEVTIVARVGEHLHFVVDPKLAQRALENVLGNAVSFSPVRGTVAVEARLTDGFVEIEVADDGTGVPDELKGRIFEKYGKLDTPGPRRGHGLGLFFVRLVVEAHDGSVGVWDRPGGGTVFRLRFPTGGLA